MVAKSIKSKAIRKYLPPDIREAVIERLADVFFNQSEEEDYKDAVINGVPGLKNASDDDLLHDLLENVPIP